jgi:hypothetical protein
LVNCKCPKGASTLANYSRQPTVAIDRKSGWADGLVTSDKEVRKLMLDREEWRSRIKMIVAANKEVDSGTTTTSLKRISRSSIKLY